MMRIKAGGAESKRKAWARRAIVWWVISSAGCKSDKPFASDETTGLPPTATQSRPLASEPKANPPGGEAQSAADDAALSESQVRAVVDRWVQAQNAGDFASYEQLYADKMLGIKRVGARTSRFAHAGWLEDRKGMFQKPFSIAIEQLAISSAAGVAVARFQQTWSNPRFKDVGPKQLVIAPESGELRIIREEMLESNLKGKPGATHVSSEALGLVRVNRGELRLLLQQEPQLNWMTGHPGHSPGGAVVRPVAPSLVPPAARALLGKTFELFDEQGARCEAKAETLEVFIDIIPHFGVINRWEGIDSPAPVPMAQRAEELWEMSKLGGRYLAVKLKPATEQKSPSACKNPLWGRAAAVEAPSWTVTTASPAQAQRLAAKARSESGFNSLLQDQKAVQATNWTPASSVKQVRLFAHRDGRRYAVVELYAPSELCGGYDRTPYWVLLRLHGSDADVVSSGEVGGSVAAPMAAVDAPNIEGPLFVTRHHVLRFSNLDGEFHLAVRQEPLDLDCGC